MLPKGGGRAEETRGWAPACAYRASSPTLVHRSKNRDKNVASCGRLIASCKGQRVAHVLITMFQDSFSW